MFAAVARVAAVRRLPAATAKTVQVLSATRAFSAKVESDEEFNKRWVDFFKTAEDMEELHRGLQNIFSYDLVPNTQILTEALKCARQYNDYPTAVRILEGLKHKIDNDGEYKQYLQELKPILDELGVEPREAMAI